MTSLNLSEQKEEEFQRRLDTIIEERAEHISGILMQTVMASG